MEKQNVAIEEKELKNYLSSFSAIKKEELMEKGDTLLPLVIGKAISKKFVNFEDITSIISGYEFFGGMLKKLSDVASGRSKSDFNMGVSQHRYNLAWIYNSYAQEGRTTTKSIITRNFTSGKVLSLELANLLLDVFVDKDTLKELADSFDDKNEDGNPKFFSFWNDKGRKCVEDILDIMKTNLHQMIEDDYNNGYEERPLYISLFNEHRSMIKYESEEVAKNFVDLMRYNDHQLIDNMFSVELARLVVDMVINLYKLNLLSEKRESVVSRINFLFSNLNKWGKKPASRKRPANKQTSKPNTKNNTPNK